MGTCLVTKLKAAVSNTNLKKMGEGEIAFQISSSQEYIEINNSEYSLVYFTEPTKVKIVSSGAYFTDAATRTQNLGTEVDALPNSTANKLVVMGSKNAWVVLRISDYYTFGRGSGTILCNGLNVLKYSTLTSGNAYAQDASLAEAGKITRLTVVSRPVSSPAGWNFSWAGAFEELGNLNLTTADMTNQANVTGSIEAFAAKVCQKYPTKSDATNCGLTGSAVLFHGATANQRLYVKFNGNGTCKITTDASYNNQVAAYNGSTWTY